MNFKRKAFLIAPIIIIGLLVLLYPAVSYWWADHEYRKLIRQKVGTKADVESLLFLYSAKQIEIKESMWGRDYKLRPGDFCVQYNIMGRDPIDIIFDHDNRVQMILSSYE
jgi:hypothetical protein